MPADGLACEENPRGLVHGRQWEYPSPAPVFGTHCVCGDSRKGPELPRAWSSRCLKCSNFSKTQENHKKTGRILFCCSENKNKRGCKESLHWTSCFLLGWFLGDFPVVSSHPVLFFPSPAWLGICSLSFLTSLCLAWHCPLVTPSHGTGMHLWVSVLVWAGRVSKILVGTDSPGS